MSLMSLSEERLELEHIKIREFVNKISQKIILDKIELKIDMESAVVKGDKHLLEVVIRNLIENSKKAEPKDKAITITGEQISTNQYKISVIDKGKGIPKEHIERVTEDFYMVDKSRSRTNGGSGIGLSLCKKILETHKSSLQIESEENIGTTVSFALEVASDDES